MNTEDSLTRLTTIAKDDPDKVECPTKIYYCFICNDGIIDIETFETDEGTSGMVPSSSNSLSGLTSDSITDCFGRLLGFNDEQFLVKFVNEFYCLKCQQELGGVTNVYLELDKLSKKLAEVKSTIEYQLRNSYEYNKRKSKASVSSLPTSETAADADGSKKLLDLTSRISLQQSVLKKVAASKPSPPTTTTNDQSSYQGQEAQTQEIDARSRENGIRPQTLQEIMKQQPSVTLARMPILDTFLRFHAKGEKGPSRTQQQQQQRRLGLGDLPLKNQTSSANKQNVQIAKVQGKLENDDPVAAVRPSRTRRKPPKFEEPASEILSFSDDEPGTDDLVNFDHDYNNGDGDLAFNLLNESVDYSINQHKDKKNKNKKKPKSARVAQARSKGAGGSSGSYQCPNCPKVFHSRSGRSSHNRFEHLGMRNKNVLVCPICGKSVNSSYQYKYHLDTHKPSRERRFVCSSCGKGYFRPSQLEAHRKLKHDPDFPEPPSSLLPDISIDSLADPTRTLCSFCGKYIAVTGYRVHLRSHNGVRPFNCEFCERRFTTKVNRDNHVATHTGERNHVCSTCGMRFRARQCYFRHLKVHRPPTYLCSYCSKSFRSKQNLEEHTNIHTHAQPFRCNLCGRRYAEKESLNAHLNDDHTAEQIREKKERISQNSKSRHVRKAGILENPQEQGVKVMEIGSSMSGAKTGQQRQQQQVNLLTPSTTIVGGATSMSTTTTLINTGSFRSGNLISLLGAAEAIQYSDTAKMFTTTNKAEADTAITFVKRN